MMVKKGSGDLSPEQVIKDHAESDTAFQLDDRKNKQQGSQKNK
jgi:hypothetical protein